MRKELLFWGLILLTIAFRFFTTRPVFVSGDLVKISSRVLTEPVNYDDSQYLRLYGLKIYLPLFPEISYGDFIVVRGTVDGDKLINPKLISHEVSKNFLISFRGRLLSFYKKTLPKRHAALVAGVVLGSKEGIDSKFWEMLKISGTAHVVVASGMNVSLVGGFALILFLTFLSRKKATIASLFFIWIYAFLAGFDAPIIRAAVMGSIAFLAVGLGRLNVSWRALFLSASIMLIIKPIWVQDLGFILSFVATASLMLFEGKINRLIHFVPSIFKEGLSTSLAAQIGVAPILYATFGQFNVLSPLINALVLWVIAPLTIVGMVAGLIGLVIPSLGKVLLYLIYPLSAWFVWIVEIFS